MRGKKRSRGQREREPGWGRGRGEAALRRDRAEKPEAPCHRAKDRLDEEQEGDRAWSRWVCSGRTVFKGDKPG